MKRVWQVQEAKNKFSEVVDEALSNGPQIITRRGEEVVVIVSSTEYRQLTAKPQRLSEFFRASPLAAADLDLSRDASAIRKEPEL